LTSPLRAAAGQKNPSAESLRSIGRSFNVSAATISEVVMTRAPAKTTKRRAAPVATGDGFIRAAALFSEAENFCRAVGLPHDLILTIAQQDSDWAFIIKIDALLETAAKEIIRRALQLKILRRVFQNETLTEFIESLPVRGRTSLIKLLEAACCPIEDIGFIEATRRVRNAYAHNIKLVDVSLVDLIKQRGDKSELLKKLSSIATFDEAKLLASYEKDPKFLRFCIVDAAMRVLFFAYHVALKHKVTK
jgi:hypothetical protein